MIDIYLDIQSWVLWEGSDIGDALFLHYPICIGSCGEYVWSWEVCDVVLMVQGVAVWGLPLVETLHRLCGLSFLQHHASYQPILQVTELSSKHDQFCSETDILQVQLPCATLLCSKSDLETLSLSTASRL